MLSEVHLLRRARLTHSPSHRTPFYIPFPSASRPFITPPPPHTPRQVYFAKFLTSAKLINLQLRDVYFRRHVLVQILMFLQTAAAQDKLLAAQRTKIEEMESRANDLLSATAPNGTRLAATQP